MLLIRKEQSGVFHIDLYIPLGGHFSYFLWTRKKRPWRSRKVIGSLPLRILGVSRKGQFFQGEIECRVSAPIVKMCGFAAQQPVCPFAGAADQVAQTACRELSYPTSCCSGELSVDSGSPLASPGLAISNIPVSPPLPNTAPLAHSPKLIQARTRESRSCPRV